MTYGQAQAELDALMAAFATQFPETNRGLGVRLIEMGRLDDEEAGPAFLIAFVTVALVLVLACANVANLLLGRGASRQRELAVRAAIGANRWHLVRQLLVEGALLALAGGAVGVLLAMLGLEALRAALPEVLFTTLPHADAIGVDRTTLAYTLAISMLTSLLFGLFPALRAARADVFDGLRESAPAGGSRGTRRLRSGLVVAEVALSTLLLVGAALLVRSYGALHHVSPGFEPAGVLTMAMSLAEDRYPEPRARLQFYDAVIERVERLQGVRAAGFVNVLPFSTYDRGTRLTVDDAPVPEPGSEPSVSYRVTSPRYHETLGIPLLEGRAFSQRDGANAAPVSIVNHALVRRHLGGRSPIGRRVRLGRDADTPWLTIVGVVGDVRHSTLTADPDPEIHVPLAQAPASMMMLALRSDSRPEGIAGAVRAAIQAVDPDQPVYHVRTLDTMVADSMLPQSASAALMAVLGVLALVLATVGVYGVVAFDLSQRTRELAVRAALGATPGDLQRLVLRGGAALVGAGLVLGMGGALAVSRLLAGALYGVTGTDPVAYSAAAGLLAATGLVASSVPAWRAASLSPLRALRAE